MECTEFCGFYWQQYWYSWQSLHKYIGQLSDSLSCYFGLRCILTSEDRQPYTPAALSSATWSEMWLRVFVRTITQCGRHGSSVIYNSTACLMETYAFLLRTNHLIFLAEYKILLFVVRKWSFIKHKYHRVHYGFSVLLPTIQWPLEYERKRNV